MGKSGTFLESKLFKNSMVVVSWLLTAAIIVFSIMSFKRTTSADLEGASFTMAIIFTLMGLSHLVYYFRDRKRSFSRTLVMALICIGLGVLVFFAKYDIYLFSISAGIFALSIIVSRVFKLVKKHTMRDIIMDIIIVLISVSLSIGFFQKVDGDFISSVVALECLFISIVVLIEGIMATLSQIKLNTFANVIVRTFALEVLLGLAALIIVASLILMNIEPSMSRFGDSLWYCFAVVTTIGFGDLVPVTPIGRVVSVFLGIYGIIVFAVLTSIIVNFYNETYGKKDAREVRRMRKNEEEK